MIKGWLTVLFFLLAVQPAAAQFDKLLKDFGGKLPSVGGLSDAKVGSGLQEALKVGTENAVQQTGSVDGFLMNKAIKILMPKPLQSMEQPLRLVGYGPQIDEFIVGMNRAAEKAVPFAKDIFWSAIGEMSFDDARQDLKRQRHRGDGLFQGEDFEKAADGVQAVGRRRDESGRCQPAVQRAGRQV